METITRVEFGKLWNSEHPLVFNRLIAIIDKHNPEALHLGGPLGRAKKHLPELDKIQMQERGSTLTKKIEETDKRSDNIIWAFTGMTNSFITANMPDTYESALIVKEWLSKHKASTIPDANYTSASERIRDLITDAERTPEIMQAIETLHQTGMFNELKSVHEQMNTLFMQRKANKAQQENIDSKAIRAAADKDMRMLFTFIELYQVENPEVDYSPLVREMNVLLKYYKNQLAARAASRLKGDKTEEESPIELPD